MSIRTAVLRGSFSSRLTYYLLSWIMTCKATLQQERESSVDIVSVMRDNNLTVLDEGWNFRGKKTVTKVVDDKGSPLILKTGRIDPFQIQLLEAAKRIEGRLFFRVPTIVNQGEGWILLEEVGGRSLNEFLDEDADQYVDVSKRVSDSYQLVIREVQRTQPLGDLLAEGQEWLLSRLILWSKSIVDSGLIDFPSVQRIRIDLEKIIAKKGENFFGWAHGNIIGDHIIISGGNVYLLDLNAVPRAGNGYHDFLRALDFMFLKTENEGRAFASIQKWIRQYLSEFDEDEVRLVFAFRNIGALGWDILHHNVEYLKGNLEEKNRLALRFIKRDY